MTIVPGFGRAPNRVMLVGESPGATEAEKLRPFVGKSGKEQKWYLSPYRLNPDDWYLTNLIKEYIPKFDPDHSASATGATSSKSEDEVADDAGVDVDDDSNNIIQSSKQKFTQAQLDHWSPVLQAEIERCRPKLIVAVGYYSMRWFLGDEHPDISLDDCHGIPHKSLKAPGSIIVPIYHPAFGFHNNDARTLIAADYSRVADTLDRINRHLPITFRVDEHAGNESYHDVSGNDLAALLSPAWVHPDEIREIALDTEGIPSDPWSIQVSWRPGTAYCLRFNRDRSDFNAGINALQTLANAGVLFILHCASTPAGCMYDIGMCRAVGLDLSRAKIFDTMYALYLLRTESRGLKPAAYRWCGMKLSPYQSIIGDIGKLKQESYLMDVISRDWPKPETTIKYSNDGTSKLYTPNNISQTTQGILRDYWSGKVNKHGQPTNLFKRWYDTDPVQRKTVESVLGRLPTGTLSDIPPLDAIRYACMDADATLRLKRSLVPELSRLDLSRLALDGCELLPMFETMQRNGMPASRRKFQSLYYKLDDELISIQSDIQSRFYGGRPFNPKSSRQVVSLMRRRGLVSAKMTSTGQMSTGKKSIEHLRFKDEAIDLVFKFREQQHLRDSFCKVILNIIPENLMGPDDIYDVRCNIKPADTETRRLASKNPNLLAIPARTEIGKTIRACYICRSGELMLACDYSQVEARVMADESADPLLCQFFIEGRDVHTETASRMFGVKPEDVTKRQRRDAKDINFGILYGIQASGLYDQFRMRGLTDWTKESCDKAIKEWYKIYKGVKDFQNKIIAEARRVGYIRDRWGMYRYLPNIWSTDPKLRAEAERHAVSHRIQGGAQGMMQNSMRWLQPTIWGMQDAGVNVKPLIMIHDELVFSCQEDVVDMLESIVIDAFVNHSGCKLRVPIEAEGKSGRSWAELK